MPFQPGQSGNPAGRPKGSRNEAIKQADEAWDSAFLAIKDDPQHGLVNWAKQNTTDFYRIYAGKRLSNAPTQANVDVTHRAIESLTEEQARVMAEDLLESLGNPA